MAIDLSKFIARFIEEARDHLTQLDAGLTAWTQGPVSAEQVHALFRSAHTLKGSSRLLKLAPITELAHRLEDVLSALRDGQIAVTPPLVLLLRQSVDALAAQVEHLAHTRDGASVPVADPALCAALTQALRGTAASVPPDVTVSARAASEPPAGDPAPPAVQPPAVTDAERQHPSATAHLAPATAGATLDKAGGDKTAADGSVRPRAADTVRVRLAVLDEVLRLLGEVIAGHDRLRAGLDALRQRGRQHDDRHDLWQLATALREEAYAQHTLMRQLYDQALVMRMLPLSIVFEPAGRLIRDLARSLGKELECTISGADIELDRQIIDRLADPVIHLLRNAVDHGLETPAERQAAGKPPQGRVTLSARQDGGWVAIDIADDGRGIDLDGVRQQALRKGLLSAEQAAAASERELIELIFLPGFSTSRFITDVSGRGVGMDVVRQCIVDELQGTVRVSSRSGHGTHFALRLPLSLAALHIMLIEAARRPFGFIAQHVAELLRVPRTALLEVAERNAVIVRNEFVPVATLAEVLHLPAAPSTASMQLLVVLQVRHEKLALAVDRLLDERAMIIKPLPEHLRHLTLVAGLVSTGDHALVSVLHAPAVLERARRLRSRSAAEHATVSAAPAPRLLVVDDSLNTREIEKDVLEAHGYRVTLAEDGLDGLNKALAESFDAVLTDIEMPRMDGFTLTERLRAQEHYRQVPIIIVTSREKAEDKRRGVQVGADAYIVKGDFDQNNLIATLRALLG